MRYEILDGLPTYGPMFVPISENGRQFYSQGFVVRFFKSDGTDWVANFELGLGGISGVYELPRLRDTIAVFAKGTCYYMTPESITPLETINGAFQQIIISNQQQLVLLDFIDITIIEPDGRHWNSERISWDGFKDIKLVGEVVTGFSFDPMDRNNEWVEFEFNITTKEVKGGSYRKYEFTPVGKNVSSIRLKGERGHKPWWRFW